MAGSNLKTKFAFSESYHMVPKQNESVSEVHFGEKLLPEIEIKQEALECISCVGEKQESIMKINCILFKYFTI